MAAPFGGGDWNGGLILCPISARFGAVIRHQAEHSQGQRLLEMGRTGARRRAAEGMVPVLHCLCIFL